MRPGQPDITVVLGASGSGKSLWIKQQLARRPPKRLVVWDPLREYDGQGERSETLDQLITHLRCPEWRAIYTPRASSQRLREEQFSMLCRLGLTAGRCTVIAEELADVTRAGYSPSGWRQLVTQGRHAGCSIIAVSQRPALIDKTVLDQATTVRVGRLNSQSSRRFLADLLDLDLADLVALKPLQWIERDMATGRVRRETLKP